MSQNPDQGVAAESPSWTSRLRRAISLVTVEPIFICYNVCCLLGDPPAHNLELEKSCRNDCGYNDTVCDAIIDGQGHLYPEELFQVQSLISQMHSWDTPLENIVPIILILFLGSYSDRRHIRKPFVILPVFAEFIYAIFFILNVMFMKEWSLNVFGVCRRLIPSLFGGAIMMEVAMYSFIADVSTEEDRTSRMTLLLILSNCCYPVVNSFNAHLFEFIGYIPVTCISVAFLVAAIIYGLFGVKEPRPMIPRDPNTGFLADIFDPGHIINTFKLPVTKVAGNNLLDIWLVIVLTVIAIGQTAAENGLYFLYTNLMFGYTVVEFTTFLFFSNLINLKGSIIAIPLFNKWLKLTDYSILLITISLKVIVNIVLALASTPVIFYIGTYIGLFSTVTPIVLRSLGTKVVRKDDIGKAQAIFGISESLGPTIFTPIYNKGIYFQTISTFPKAFLLVGMFLGPLCILMVLFLKYKSKKDGTINEGGRIYEQVASNLEEAIDGESNKEQLENTGMRN